MLSKYTPNEVRTPREVENEKVFEKAAGDENREEASRGHCDACDHFSISSSQWEKGVQVFLCP